MATSCAGVASNAARGRTFTIVEAVPTSIFDVSCPARAHASRKRQ